MCYARLIYAIHYQFDRFEMADVASDDSSILLGILVAVGAVVAPLCIVLYIRPDSFVTFVGLVIGGIVIGSSTGLLLYYALPFAIGLAVLWILYGLYKFSWQPALFGLMPLAVAIALLRWKQIERRIGRGSQAETSIGFKSGEVAALVPRSPGDGSTNKEAVALLPEGNPSSLPLDRQEKSPMREGWDLFISHASEDKVAVAKPLAFLLRNRGVRVWLDESELHIGDSLRQKIDEGLARSRYGVVILSKSFFEKDWPQRELNGLSSRESISGKVILPVWHGVDREYVSQYSLILADKLAANTRRGIEAIADEIFTVIGADTKLVSRDKSK